jgi:predicted transcriptional regulator
VIQYGRRSDADKPTNRANVFGPLARAGGCGLFETLYAQRIVLGILNGMQKSIPSVKTAVSLKRPLFQQVDKIAREQKLPRSRVFVMALEAYVARYQSQILLDKLNSAYADEPEASEKKRTKAAKKTHRRIVEGEW